jgi:predicted nuclease of predicted toxin-antitoxin system
MAKVKLLLDEDVHLGLASALRKRGYDATHVQELARTGRSDREQMEYAIAQESCIFTFNVKDFVLLHNHKNNAVSGKLRVFRPERETSEAIYCP